MEIVKDYGDWLAEYKALRENAGILNLNFRSRICLIGNDRARFLHGQVTNDVKKLRVGQGCYSAVTTAKGKMESDLHIFNLQDELLLDFEPGLTKKISARLEKFIVADDVQIVDAAPHYGLLSAQGPQAQNIIHHLNLFPEIPAAPLDSVKISDATFGEIYLANNPRLENFCRIHNPQSAIRNPPETPDVVSYGFDLFVPNPSLAAITDKLIAAAKSFGGCAAGWTAFEIVRIENGVPRFGADMDETNLPLECGIENRALVYDKGCYIGQEIINRVHSFGRVTKELRGLKFADDLKTLPQKNDKLFWDGKEIGYVTSAAQSPEFGIIALGYVRREANQIGTEMKWKTVAGESSAKIVDLPFTKNGG